MTQLLVNDAQEQDNVYTETSYMPQSLNRLELCCERRPTLCLKGEEDGS